MTSESKDVQSEPILKGDDSQLNPAPLAPGGDEFAEFEIGHHKVPWFLWLFFALIVTWASISWIKFFGY